MTNAVPADVVREGDLVTVQFAAPDGSTKPDDLIVITGRLRLSAGDLMLGRYVVAHANGNHGPDAFCITDHLPAEPPVGVIVQDDEGDYWAHLPEGWVVMTERARAQAFSWRKISTDYGVLEVVKTDG